MVDKIYFQLPGYGLTAAQSQTWSRLRARPAFGRSPMDAAAAGYMGLPRDSVSVGLHGSRVTLYLPRGVRQPPTGTLLQGARRWAGWMQQNGIPVSPSPSLLPVNISRSRVTPQRRSPSTLRRTAFRGFGQTEEAVEEVVQETAGPASSNGLKTAISIGAVAVIGAGLFYGLSR